MYKPIIAGEEFANGLEKTKAIARNCPNLTFFVSKSPLDATGRFTPRPATGEPAEDVMELLSLICETLERQLAA